MDSSARVTVIEEEQKKGTRILAFLSNNSNLYGHMPSVVNFHYNALDL